MGNDGILAKAKGRYSLKDVELQQVEVVSVLEVEEFNTLVAKEVEAQSASLASEIERLKSQLAEAEGGGLEQAAADAALQAESAALEEKAAAEQRAEAAEAKVTELTRRLEQFEKPPEPEPEPEPAEPEGVTEEDHSRARRLADTLIDDVVDDGEEKTTKALAGGTFAKTFAKQLENAKKTFDRRTPEGVSAERDHWAEAVAALEAKHKA